MDKYDEAIKHLTDHPDQIQMAWMDPSTHVAGCLFQFATKTGRAYGFRVGCLTSVHSSGMNAETPELTLAIRADTRIPHRKFIAVADLPVFAERQRRLDEELDRA